MEERKKKGRQEANKEEREEGGKRGREGRRKELLNFMDQSQVYI